MSNISDLIEKFILNVIDESKEAIINRNDLANRFDCASSQINYVLSTRFTADKGYSIESRRGGGGYIRLYRMSGGGDAYYKRLLDDIKDRSLSYNRCTHIIERLMIDGVISAREKDILSAALGDKALKGLKDKDEARSGVLSEVIINLWKHINRI
ncbi:MAG: CtsR family transcriptional regulator [Clostridiales bacterium]|jgi:transcriptional regulator CtsR|nr:CtsR family transcriptional regulator [Clostridiales bacterium]